MIKFNNGMVRIDVTLNKEQFNDSILSFISSVHDVEKKNTSIMWDSTSGKDILIEDEMNFSCKINLRSKRISETNLIEYNELIVLEEKSNNMKENIIFMLIEFLDLDDHEFARELKHYEIIPIKETDSFKFVLTFSFQG